MLGMEEWSLRREFAFVKTLDERHRCDEGMDVSFCIGRPDSLTVADYSINVF